MIKEFVQSWERNKGIIKASFEARHPDSYKDIVRLVVENLVDEDASYTPDPERIHCIDDGDYQGTLLFVIAAKGCQPDKYWYVKISYGSCSGCDTLEGIRSYSDELPTEDQVKQYMQLALHVVQRLKEMCDEEA